MAPKLTHPLRPVARYRKGKPLPGTHLDINSDSDQDDDDDNKDDDAHHLEREEQSLLKAGLRVLPQPGTTSTTTKGRLQVAINQVQVDEQGKVKVGKEQEGASSSSEYETDSQDERSAPPKPTFNKPGTTTTTKTTAAAQEDSSEYETDSEQDDDEEQDERHAPIYKPVFVSKRHRDTIATRDAELDPSVLEAKREAELQERKKQSHDLVAQSIIRELATKDVEAVFPDVDDTDGLDPQAEFDAWKLRELMRIKRDKEARYAREKEREEVEARRSIPEQLRMKDDLEHAQRTRDEKKRGSQVLGQKYHHKGAFYADDDILKKHDYTAPTISTVDVSSLPKAMQNKNFGKMSQSKYTHLADQDTSKEAGWGRTGTAGGKRAGAGASGCFNCGGPHLRKDCTTAGPSGSGPKIPSTRDNGWSSRDREREREKEDQYTAPSRRDDRDRYAERDDRRDDDRGYARYDDRRGDDYGRRRDDDGEERYRRRERERDDRPRSPSPRRERERDDKRRRLD